MNQLPWISLSWHVFRGWRASVEQLAPTKRMVFVHSYHQMCITCVQKRFVAISSFSGRSSDIPLCISCDTLNILTFELFSSHLKPWTNLKCHIRDVSKFSTIIIQNSWVPMSLSGNHGIFFGFPTLCWSKKIPWFPGVPHMAGANMWRLPTPVASSWSACCWNKPHPCGRPQQIRSLWEVADFVHQ